MIQRLTRPPRGASREVNVAFWRDLNALLDTKGIEPGLDFTATLVQTNGHGVLEAVEPGARRTDPATSKRAAKQHIGKAGTHRHTAFMAIGRSGGRGATQRDLLRSLGIEGIWKRISELHEWGWINATAAERDGCTVYVLSGKGRAGYERELAGLPADMPVSAEPERLFTDPPRSPYDPEVD